MNKLYIIGNGFDLDLGLPTGYQDYLNSPNFKEMLGKNSDNRLAGYLQELQEKDKWVDIELALRGLAKAQTDVPHSGGVLSERNYEEIVQRLRLYLSTIDLHSMDKRSTAYKVAWDMANEVENKVNIRVVNFNYTESIEKILAEHDRLEEIKKRIIHPHGKLSNGNIVFGIEDGTGIRHAFNYLKKSSRPGYVPITWWYEYLENVTEICIYGHSLGESDNMYFKEMFQQYLNNWRLRRKITVYHRKGDEDMYRDRLIDLVDDRVQKFKSSHTYETVAIDPKKI